VITSTLDVLCIGAGGAAEYEALRAAGLQVERADTLVAAMERLRTAHAALVVADADVCAYREREVFESLRDVGVSATIALYPQALAWRAPRAIDAGADDAFTLPTPPGAVRTRALALLAAARGAAPAAPSSLDDDSLASLVADITAVNRQIGDLDRALEEIVRAFVRRSSATRCSVLLLDEAHATIRVAKAVGLPDATERPPVAVGEGLAGRVAKTGAPLVAPDVNRLEGDGATDASYRTRSCLLVPLRAPRGVIGVVCVADNADGSAFGDEDLETLLPLAEQCAQSVDNALQFRQMRDLATIDELTGVGNRRHFQRMLERELKRAERYGRRMTLALFDVDHFKKYNDSCGHPAGDRALATIGRLLRESLRDVDIVARYGGEEFAVILPETAPRPGDGAGPYPFLERLRARVETEAFPGEEALPSGKLTLSGGVASFPDDGKTAEELVQAADRALYLSKDRGRNTITYRGAPLTA